MHSRSSRRRRKGLESLSSLRRKRYARRRSSTVSSSEDETKLVKKVEGNSRSLTKKKSERSHGSHGDGDVKESRALSVEQEGWVEKHSSRLPKEQTGAVSDATRTKRRLKASFRKFCRNRSSLETLRLFCKEHMPLYSDDVHFLKSVLNFKTAETPVGRRQAARIIYKAYLQESHVKSASVSRSAFSFSSGSIPAIFGGQKQRRTNLEEDEVKELAEYIMQHKDEKLSPHVFDVAESKIMDVVALRVFAKFREHENKEKDAEVTKIREVRNLAAATVERDDQSMAAPNRGRMRAGSATASAGVGFRKKHPEQFLKTYSHDYDDIEGLGEAFHTVGPSRILKQGWLMKKGEHRRAWQKRWFVLKGQTLCYYAKQDDVEPRGVIELDGFHVARAPVRARKKYPFSFDIYLPERNGRIYSLNVVEGIMLREMEEWIAAIRYSAGMSAQAALARSPPKKAGNNRDGGVGDDVDDVSEDEDEDDDEDYYNDGEDDQEKGKHEEEDEESNGVHGRREGGNGNGRHQERGRGRIRNGKGLRESTSHSARAKQVQRRLSLAQREWVELHAKRMLQMSKKSKRGKDGPTVAKELVKETYAVHGVSGLVKLLEMRGDNSSVVVEACREIYKTAIEGKRVGRLRLKRSGALLVVLSVMESSGEAEHLGKEHMVIAACAETLKICAQDEDICAYLVENEAFDTVRKALRRIKQTEGEEAQAIAGLVKELAGQLALSTIELET